MTLRAALQIVTADTTLDFDRVHRYVYVDRACELFELTVVLDLSRNLSR